LITTKRQSRSASFWPTYLPISLSNCGLPRPRPVFLELPHHSRAGARNAEDVLVRRGVQIDRNEHVLFQLVGRFLTDVFADLAIELREGLPRTIFGNSIVIF
jgi:hypothetical protein